MSSRLDFPRCVCLALAVFGFAIGTANAGSTIAASTQPATTRAAASISIEIDPGQRWPGDVRVKVTCEAPADEKAARKHVQLVDVDEARLTELRAQVAENHRRWKNN